MAYGGRPEPPVARRLRRLDTHSELTMRTRTVARLVIAFLAVLAGVAGVAGLADRAMGQAGSVTAPLAAESLLLDIVRAGDRLVAVGERGHVLLSDDSGITWRQVLVPTRATLTAVTFVDPMRGWTVGHDAVVLHTGDGGESWVEQYADPDFETPLLDVLFSDADTGFAVGAYGLFLETVDGGATWEQRWVAEDDFHFNAILNPAPGQWFMAGEVGGLYRSDDGGGEWQLLDSPYLGSFFGALALGDDGLLVFGLQGKVFRSDDSGESWQPVETRTTAALVAGAVLSDGRLVVVGLGGAVLVSDDGGRSFRRSRRDDRSALSGVVEAPDDRLVLVGEAGFTRIGAERLAQVIDGSISR